MIERKTERKDWERREKQDEECIGRGRRPENLYKEHDSSSSSFSVNNKERKETTYGHFAIFVYDSSSKGTLPGNEGDLKEVLGM